MEKRAEIPKKSQLKQLKTLNNRSRLSDQTEVWGFKFGSFPPFDMAQTESWNQDTDPKIGNAASMNVLDNNEARLITKGSTGVQNSEDWQKKAAFSLLKLLL